MACVEDSIDDLFTEEDCCWKWDVPVDQHFAPGKDIGVMTYAEMYAKVNEWHMKAAGTSLCVHCRMPRGAKPGADAPHIVQFYCSHGRDHGDQSGRKEPKAPEAVRADRTQEKIRTKFSNCCFSCTVRRDVLEDDDAASSEASSDVRAGPGSALSGHQKHLKNTTKFLWYFDNVQRQKTRKTRGPKPQNVNEQWSHSGHLKSSHHVGKVTPDMLSEIKRLITENIGVPSMQSLLFKKYDVYLSDHQLYWALDSLGYSVTENGLTKDHIPQSARAENDCQSLLNNLTRDASMQVCLLVENVGKSQDSQRVFETYRKNCGKHDFILMDDEYDGTDCCKKTAAPTKGMASRHGEETINGVVYDSSRFVTINGQRLFFISVVWIQERELKNFSAYPEVMIMDDKKKTNQLQHSFFAAIGVDALWRNNTLFRAWSPNNTHDALNWMMSVAFTLLVPASLRARIKGVFTDHCGTMTPILAKVCGDADVLPNAKHFLCIYHVLRNFYQEFGQGTNGRWKLKRSTQQYRKGGDIAWAYNWQKHCASSIFRLGVCETKSEFDECKEHVVAYIKKTKAIAHPGLRDAVMQFFAQKFEDADKWSLYARLHHMCLDISSTSRAEGEFSALHLLKLSVGMGFVRALQKIKWQSDRRYNRKMFLSQRNMNTVIKRKSEHCPSMEEWRALDKKFTSHYLNMIEKEMERAHCYTYQVVEVERQGESVTDVIVAVFVRREGDRDDAQVMPEDDGEGDIADNADADSAMGNVELEEIEEEEAQAEKEEGFGNDSDSDVVVLEAPSASHIEEVPVVLGDDDWSPFLYRRVRKVKITVTTPSTVTICCDCGHMSRTTYICGHILCLKKAIHGQDFDILHPDQKFHPRLLKSLYWGVHHSEKRVDHDDGVPLPLAPREAFMEWFRAQPAPSYIGVPEVGQIGQLQNGTDAADAADNDTGDVQDASGTRRSKTRIQKLHIQKLTKLQENHYELMDICKHNRDAAEKYVQDQEALLNQFRNRKRARQPGRKQIDRLRGGSDRKKGESAHAYKPRKRSKVDDDPVLKLRDRILKHGLPSGSYVRIKNKQNEKWFMRIVKGNIIDADGDDPALEKALWCEQNSVCKLAKGYPAQKCEIATIEDAGTYNKFKKMLEKT